MALKVNLFFLQRGIVELLRTLELQEYEELFSKQGYGTEDDIENLKDLQEKELREMGVHKRGEPTSSPCSASH